MTLETLVTLDLALALKRGSSVPSGSSVFSGPRREGVPLLGDEDYLDFLEAAFESGHVTEQERRETRRVHLARFHARPSADEAATLAEVDALGVEGVLREVLDDQMGEGRP